MKLWKYNINIITQKLVTSKRLIKNKFKGRVLFEKYEPHKAKFVDGFLVETGTVSANSSFLTISSSNRVSLGNSNSSGGYDIGGDGNFLLMVTKKPNFFHRNMVRLFLGWKYMESNKNKSGFR